ncbi:MAG: TRL-like family protein [Cryomorphaceae bacterium]
MKKFKSLALVATVGLLLSSCAMTTSPVSGFVYTDVDGPVAVTSNTVGSKVGTASVKSVLGIVGTGNASINEAAKKAGITKISHVDYHSTNVLGIFATFEVRVYGE